MPECMGKESGRVTVRMAGSWMRLTLQMMFSESDRMRFVVWIQGKSSKWSDSKVIDEFDEG